MFDRNRVLLQVTVMALVAVFSTAKTFGEDEENEKNEAIKTLNSIKWQNGPTTAQIGTVAEIFVPKGFRFAGPADARRLLEMMENPTDGSELGLLGPVDLRWFVTFEYDDVGYVKDDEKDSLDANAMLASIREGTEQANKVRKERGWSTMRIVGWQQPPHYDTESNNLVWAIKGESEHESIINHHTRRLGRGGVMSVGLVADPKILNKATASFDELMSKFQFIEGQKYSEFHSGDKIAEYGLTALVTGGAAALAVKSGAFKWLWKLGVAAVVAIGAGIKKLFGRSATA